MGHPQLWLRREWIIEPASCSQNSSLGGQSSKKMGQIRPKNQWWKQLKLLVKKNFVIKGHGSVVSWNKQQKTKSAWSITRILAYFRKDLFSKNILNVKIQAKGKHNKERVLQVSLLWRALAILASEESQTGNEKVGKKWKQWQTLFFRLQNHCRWWLQPWN